MEGLEAQMAGLREREAEWDEERREREEAWEEERRDKDYEVKPLIGISIAFTSFLKVVNLLEKWSTYHRLGRAS